MNNLLQSQHYQELLHEVESHQASINELNDKNHELFAVLRDYKKKHKDLETQIGTLSYENSNLIHDIDRLKAENEEKITENSRLHDVNVKLSGDIKAHQESCKSNQTPPKVRASLQFQIQNLRRENQTKDQENEKLKQRLRKSKEEMEKLVRNALSERERMQQETKDLIDVVGKQKSQIVALRSEIECKENEVLRAIETKNVAVRKCQEVDKNFGQLEKRHATLNMREER